MSKNLISELNDLLAAADQKIFELEDVVDEDIFSKLSGTLFNLNNKHIPPEICSEIKLMERIDEANILIEEIENMKKNILEVDNVTLLECAEKAILRWNGLEGTKAKALQQGCAIDKEFIRSWLSEWGLSISNPNKYRENLVAFLRDRARPAIQVEKESMLPTLVQKLVLEMVDAKAAPNKQTSLMSKFAFSLRPEALVPYDARARDGIKNAIGSKIVEHDYVDYIEKFNDHILPAAEQALESYQLFDKLSDKWRPTMSRELFIRRTADKLFMVLGGFDVNNL